MQLDAYPIIDKDRRDGRETSRQGIAQHSNIGSCALADVHAQASTLTCI